MTQLELLSKKREEAENRLKAKYSNKIRINIGMATCEIAAGSKEVWEVFEKSVNTGEIKIDLAIKGCAGRCNFEPTIEVNEKGKLPVKYCKVTPEMAKNIIERHIKKGEVIEEYIIR